MHNAGIVFGGDNTIEGVDADGSGRHVVATGYGDMEGDPAWSRDGQALAFWVRRSDTVEIHVLWPGTKAHRVLSSDLRSPAEPRRTFAYIVQPSWAPDGDHIAVSDTWHGAGPSNSTIRIVSAATERWTSLTRPSSHLTDTEPAWSPDGRTIAFTRQRDYGKAFIYLIGRDGRGLRRLTEGWSPSWSPDGRDIAFNAGASVHRIGADGRGRTRLTRGPRVGYVRWSPDGRKILYTAGVDGGHADVWVMDSDGTDPVRVLQGIVGYGIGWQPG